MKRARSLSSIFTSEDDVLQVDAGQADETLAVIIFHSAAVLLWQHLCCAPASSTSTAGVSAKPDTHVCL